jgi:hypothetical protein
VRFDLLALARRATNRRRRTVTLRDVVPPAVLATDLYRAVYAPVVEQWARAAERLAAEYARTLAAMTTDAPADLGTTLEQAEAELSRLILLLRPAMRVWTLRVEAWQRGKWVGAALAASGVNLATLLGPGDVQDTLEALIERNVGLVRDVGEQARQRMASAVFEGLRARTPAREVAAQLREASAMSRRRSVNIASDQLTKATSALADERRRQAGIDEWEWVHSRKAHPRSEHVARNGKVYSDTSPPPTMPGQEPFCGCRQRAVLRFD